MIKYKGLEIVDLCDEDNLIEKILHKTDMLGDCDIIEVCAKSEMISYIFTTLLSMDFQVGTVDFDALSCDYCGEYTLMINKDREIWLTPSYYKTDGHWEPFNSYATHVYLYIRDVDISRINCILDTKLDVVLFGFEVGE